MHPPSRFSAASTTRVAASVALSVATWTGCAPRGDVPTRSPPDHGPLTTAIASAFEEEAHGSPVKATRLYLDVVDAAVASPPDAWQLDVVSAALDALVFRTVGALASVSADTALVYRTLDPSLTSGESLGALPRSHDPGSIAARLQAAYTRAVGRGPFVPGLIAEAMTEIAEYRGDVGDASRWREATGCAREATVVGPLDWAPLTGVARPDPLAAFDAKLASGYPAPGAFLTVLPPVVERGRGCEVDLSAASSNAGVRDVVVDVDVPRAQRVGVALRFGGTATLRVGGKLVLERPYDLGGGDVSRYARVDVAPGTLRLVARVGMDQEGEALRIGVWDDAGRPLPVHAPRPGDAATALAHASEPLAYPTPRAPAEALTVALAALAMQDPGTAENVLEHDATREGAAPDLALAYGRAVEDARDLSTVHRTERARTAYERVLAAWPGAWEALLAHASLTGAGRGPGDARFAELDDLATRRTRAGKAAADAGPMLDAFELVLSGREHLWDRAREAKARLETTLAHSAFFADVDRAAFERSPADLKAFDCAARGPTASPRPRSSLACYNSLHAEGDLTGGLAELERLRAVNGGVDLYLALTLRDGLALGSRNDVDRALRDMLPAEVTLSSVYGLALLDPTRGTAAADTDSRVRAIFASAHDAPIAIAPLLRALHDDPAAPFAGVAEAVVDEDRAHPVLPGTATAVLRHDERYDVFPSGVTHAVVFDVRRVSGTADVEANAQVSAPALTGRTALRILRKRVLKHDGTVVEPDPNPGASQGHADLAQLEAGDVVEAIYEGWSVPLETGEIGFDSVDLLPDRTAVHEATVTVRVPTGLRMSLWSHPILGAPVTQTLTEGEATVTELRWSLKDHLARRVEDATPKMDRSVAVSLSTTRWGEIARGLREAVAAREDHDPSVDAWARDVAHAANATSDRAKVEAVVAAVGAAVKEGDPGDLSDILYGHAIGPQTTTARGILSDHEGSRTWLIVRALHALGVPCEVVVAENEPWSASPDFPPHLGRFVHPLAVAHVRADAAGAFTDLPVDADVSGPPLPAGHVSPELRGRLALHEDGAIAPLAYGGGDASLADGRDEIDERLTLDSQGDARGTFTIVLRGRDAQEIASVLEREVGDQRQRALRAIVLAWVPFANVDSIGLSSSEGSWQVAVRADVTIPGYAQADGKPSAAGATWLLPGLDPTHEVYPRGYSSTLSATYASEGAREGALAVSRAVQYHARRRIELPAGSKVGRTPAGFEVLSPTLAASRKLHATVGAGNTVVEDDLTLVVTTGTVPASGYAKFVEAAHRSDDAFLASTRVVVPPGRH